MSLVSLPRLYRCLAVWLVLILLVPVAEAAGLGLTVHRIDSSQFPMVRVYATVATSQGVPIRGLDKAAFELLEDDKPIQDFQLGSMVDSSEPIAVALTMDVSGSMNDQGKLDAAKQAASTFVDSMGVNDSASIVVFSAAIPFQGGANHVNEQWQDYWAARFEELGYVSLDPIRPRVWSDDRVEWW